MPQQRRSAVGIELVRMGVVKESDVRAALAYQKDHSDKKIGEILHILKAASDRTLLKAIGEILGEKVMLISKESLRVQTTDYISLDVAKHCRAVIFDVENGKAKVCFSDTTNIEAVNQIKSLLLHHGLIMEKYLTFDTNIEAVLTTMEGKSDDNIATSNDIVGLVDTIMKSAFEKRTSDVHIEPLENSIRVRFRIDGDLVTVANIPKSKQPQLIRKIKSNIKYAPRKTFFTRW